MWIYFALFQKVRLPSCLKLSGSCFLKACMQRRPRVSGTFVSRSLRLPPCRLDGQARFLKTSRNVPMESLLRGCLRGPSAALYAISSPTTGATGPLCTTRGHLRRWPCVSRAIGLAHPPRCADPGTIFHYRRLDGRARRVHDSCGPARPASRRDAPRRAWLDSQAAYRLHGCRTRP